MLLRGIFVLCPLSFVPRKAAPRGLILVLWIFSSAGRWGRLCHGGEIMCLGKVVGFR